MLLRPHHSTPSSDDPVIVPLAQSTSQHVKNFSEKPKKKPESKFKCDRSNDKVGENESENPEVLELRNKKKEKREEQYERWKNSAEYFEWKNRKTEKSPTSKRPNKKVQTDTNLSTKAEQEVGNSKKRKIVANRRLTSNEIENLLNQ